MQINVLLQANSHIVHEAFAPALLAWFGSGSPVHDAPE
jgi:hypothetical protein